jgi:lysophospholipase L1-like esterase
LFLVAGIFLLSTSLYPLYSAGATHVTSVCTDEIKVMPLGDSITTGKYSGDDTSDTPAGAQDDIGYRKDLWEMLKAAGFKVDFVGTQSNGTAYPFSDPEHEGHNGWTDAQIADNIYDDGGENWLLQNPPDVVLLHIGTNDLEDDPSDVERILDEIDAYESATGERVIVILARIINMVNGNQVVSQFNENVALMAASRPEYGRDLYLVDMEDGAGLVYNVAPAGDMWDNIHPYATGYTKMAAAWLEAFENLCQRVYLPAVLVHNQPKKYFTQ